MIKLKGTYGGVEESCVDENFASKKLSEDEDFFRLKDFAVSMRPSFTLEKADPLILSVSILLIQSRRAVFKMS